MSTSPDVKPYSVNNRKLSYKLYHALLHIARVKVIFMHGRLDLQN